MRIPLVLGRKSDKARAPMESAERLVNAYVDVAPDGKEPTPIYGTQGFNLWATALASAVRGWTVMGGVLYAVAGTSFYSFAADGTPTDRGTIPGTDLVDMAADGSNVVTVAGGEIYVWNGTTLGAVTDPDAPNASSVEWMDGFFVFGETDTQQFFISALQDPTNYDALDFASAEWEPDFLVAPRKLHRTLFMFGRDNIEAQQNVGGSDFPFAPVQDVTIGVGLVGRDAVVATNDTFFWLASDLTARRLDGITATPISTGRIARIIASWSDPSATVASAEVLDDHLMIKFRNPDGCVVFDQTTEMWHERESYNQVAPIWRHYTECYGLKLVASATEGKIYRLDDDTFEEDGEPLPFEVVTPYAYAQNKRLSIGELEVVAQTGVGRDGENPPITCERTKDGDEWSQPKIRYLGRQGVRGAGRVLFGPQGQGRAMAFRLRITSNCRRAILGIYAEGDAEA